MVISAGLDATVPFEDVGHSADARKLLEAYYVGELVEVPRAVAGRISGCL